MQIYKQFIFNELRYILFDAFETPEYRVLN